MCIIAVKKPGVDMPSEEIIENMWNANPDGAGIMWNSKGKVHIEKGFMTLAEFNARLKEINPATLKEKAVVLHFRITTHGGTCKENCHPFPVTSSKNMLTKPIINTDLGMAHNGIISSITPRNGISDTMEYNLSQLSVMKKIDRKFYTQEKWLELIENAIDSKMVFLDSQGNISIIGSFEEENGILYSNNTYKTFRNRWYNSLDDDAWYPYGLFTVRSLMDIDDWAWHNGLASEDYIIADAESGIPIQEEALYCSIDKHGSVYAYDWELDAYTLAPTWKALDINGEKITFDPKFAKTEDIYTEE